MEITPQQRDVLRWLLDYHEGRGYMPSIREMQRLKRWKSHYSAQRFMTLFRERGWITEAAGSRAFVITPAGRRAAK